MAELAAGASDQELARWLAGILVADPGWLEVFLKSVPEDRGEELCREVLEQLMGLDEGSLWAVLRASPTAMAVANGSVSVWSDPFSSQPVAIAGSRSASSEAVDTILDPASAVDPSLLSVLRVNLDAPSASRLLEAWGSGKLSVGHRALVTAAWMTLLSEDPAALEGIIGRLPEELKADAERMSGWATTLAKNPLEVPPPDLLARLNSVEIEHLQGELLMAGLQFPLEYYEGLSLDQRSAALMVHAYNLIPIGNLEGHLAGLDRLDEMALSDQEKSLLLSETAEFLWKEQGEIGRALELASRIPDPQESAEASSRLLRGFAEEDPAAALDFAGSMAEGPQRDALMETAERFLR